MPAFTPGWDAFPQPLLEFWTERHLCTLTTLDRRGLPHVVPVGVALDPEQRCAWVITSADSVKVRHLREPGPVAACQVDGARWSTLEAVASVHTDADSVARAVDRYAARYRQPRENDRRVALRLEVTRFLAGVRVLPPG